MTAGILMVVVGVARRPLAGPAMSAELERQVKDLEAERDALWAILAAVMRILVDTATDRRAS